MTALVRAVAAVLGRGRLRGRGGVSRRLGAVPASLFRDPDLGPVDFASLRRRRTRNDALACPHGWCRGVVVDVVAPVFDLPQERLRALSAEVARREPGAKPVTAGEDQERYVVRTRFLRFPDTVDIRIIDLGEGRSTLAIYSRSRFGFYDFGANRRRIRRWLQRLTDLARKEPRVSVR